MNGKVSIRRPPGGEAHQEADGRMIRPFDPPPALMLSHAVLDALMPRCDPYEWKIICAVLRHQGEPRMSVGKFMQWTGLQHRKTCFDTLTRCLRKGYLVREPVGNSFTYRPNPELAFPSGAAQ